MSIWGLPYPEESQLNLSWWNNQDKLDKNPPHRAQSHGVSAKRNEGNNYLPKKNYNSRSKPLDFPRSSSSSLR